MTKILTLTLPDDVVAALYAKAGDGGVEAYIEQLMKPLVHEDALVEGYQAMAADGLRETEALECYC